MLYGHMILRVYERLKALGLTRSRAHFSAIYCDRDEGYMRDLVRRDGPTSLVSSRTVRTIRIRLAEAAALLPAELAEDVRAIDDAIVRDQRVAQLLSRRSNDARSS